MSVVKVTVSPSFNENFELQDEVLYGHSLRKIDNIYTTFYGYNVNIPNSHVSHENYSPTHIVVSNFAIIRERDEIKSPVLITLVKGSFISLIKDNVVLLTCGTLGFIDLNSIRAITKDKNLIISSALSYLEVPYKWGGKTPMGIDCSGLVFMSYLLAGFTIYRDAILKEPLREINAKEMKPSDIIFFEGHVAIYLGNGNIIHASSKNGAVKIEDLSKRGDIKRIGTYF